MKNTMMEVQLGDFGTIHVGHKTQMGKAQDIVVVGNHVRELSGLNPITLDSILRKQDFWEFAIVRNAHLMQSADSGQTSESEVWVSPDYDQLKSYKTEKGELKYAELMRQLPQVIRSQRGGKVENRGVWMELYLLLKLAAFFSKELEHEIYDTFIEGKILQHRDAGGEAFKLLNQAIDTLPDRSPELKPKGNKGCYIQAAKMLREKLGISDSKGYNEGEHDSDIQKQRDRYEQFLVQSIGHGFIASFDQLKTAIDKLD